MSESMDESELKHAGVKKGWKEVGHCSSRDISSVSNSSESLNIGQKVSHFYFFFFFFSFSFASMQLNAMLNPYCLVKNQGL